MGLSHHSLVKWEEKLRDVFREIDAELERRYGDRYPRRPGRPAAGSTSSFEQDGLFNVGAVYSPGFGSRHGAGYTVEIRWSTLADVPESEREALQEEVAEELRKRLPEAFPDRDLGVSREGARFRIHGDLSLGEA